MKATLERLEQMTPQQVFDEVADHLRKQGEPAAFMDYSAFAEDEKVSCLYRRTKDDGKVLKCAAGCLILDKDYRLDFEGRGWNSITNSRYVHNELIGALQAAHDYLAEATMLGDHDWANIEPSLQAIASDHGLTYRFPKE